MPGIPEYGIEPGLRRMFRMGDEPDDVARMVETYRAIDTMAVFFRSMPKLKPAIFPTSTIT
jgi:hypothetical protein